MFQKFVNALTPASIRYMRAENQAWRVLAEVQAQRKEPTR